MDRMGFEPTTSAHQLSKLCVWILYSTILLVIITKRPVIFGVWYWTLDFIVRVFTHFIKDESAPISFRVFAIRWWHAVENKTISTQMIFREIKCDWETTHAAKNLKPGVFYSVLLSWLYLLLLQIPWTLDPEGISLLLALTTSYKLPPSSCRLQPLLYRT